MEANIKHKKHYISGGTIVKAAIIIFALIAVLLPLIFVCSNSVKPNLEMYNNPRIFPSKLDWSHFQKILSPNFQTVKYFFNSLIITAVTTVFSVLFGSIAAYGLNKLGGRKLTNIISILIMVVRFYPKITVVIPYFLVIKNIGLLDSRLGIILSHISITLPLVMMMMATFFKDIPKEIEESAFLDGAGLLRTFVSIIIPMATAGLAAAAIITAMTSWNEFLIASSISSQQSATLPILVSGFITDKGTDYGAMSALSIISILPMLVLVLFSQKFLVKGLTAGAVKG